MKRILGVLAILAILITIVMNNYTSTESTVIKMAERCYFEGQRDVLKGDTRIKMNSDSTYVWVKSPWYGTDWEHRQPLYVPDYIDSNK